MTNIIKQGSTLVIQGDAKSYPFKDGKISLPLNSLYFVIDESNVVSFKQINDNNTLLSVNINDLQINGEQATKENLIEKFDAVANGSMGGSKLNAGTNIILQPQEDGSITISATGELTQSVEWTDVLNKPSDIVNITDKLAEKLDKTVYEADKSTFALKSEIPSIDNLATKEELSTKQDVLVSGTNIKTINGETLLGNGDIVIEGDVTKQYVDEQLALKADKTAIADMLTKTEASTTYATKEEIPSLDNYLTIAQGDEKYQVKGNYITSELAEETYAKKTDIPDTSNFATKEELEAKADVTALASKQDTLVSGVNIKTINGQTLLGEGNIEIQGGSGSGIPDAPSDDKLYGRKNGNWSEVIIPSTDNFATKEDISDMLTKSEASSTYQPKGEYLTSIPEEYVTDEELNAKGYATTSQLDSKLDVETYNSDKTTFALKTELTDFITVSVDNLVNYYTKSETYTQSEINAKISAITTINFEVVAELPESGEANKIYLVPNKAQTEQNIKDEYIWIEDKWEIIGSTQIDLSNYYNKGEVDNLVNVKLDTATYNIDKATFALKSELTNLATKQELSEGLETKQDKGDYANRSDLANYLLTATAEETYQPIGDYATTTQLNSKADKTELENYVTTETAEATYAKKSEIPEEYTLPIATSDALGGIKVGAGLSINPETGVLSATGGGVADSVDWANVTSKPDDIVNITDKLAEKLDVSTYNSDKETFATKEELADKANSSDLSNYVTTVNAEATYAKKNEIPSLEGYLQTSVADEKYATKTELSGKADKTAIADMLTKTEAASTYQPKGEYITEIPAEYITESELNAKGYKKIEYLTQTQYDELPTKEEGVMYVITDAAEVVIPDTSTFATKEEIADMATKTWVGEQGFLTSHQDISNLATKQELSEGLATKQDKGNYLTVETADGKYQVKGDYATKSELANKVDTSTYTEDKATFALKSELTDFITVSVDNLVNYYKKSETYTKGEVDGKISAITTINFEVVGELPVSGEANKIYLVPNAEQGEQNVKDEYIWVDGKWEIIGSTKVDLSNYYNKGEVDSKLSEKVDLSTYTSDKETFALKSELTTLATKEELALKANTSDLSAYLTSANAESTYAKKSEIPSLEGYLQTSVADEKYATKTELSGKQDTLESGTNIKTINGESILGSGDIVIEGGSGGDVTKQYVDEQLALKADKTSVPTVQENNIGDTNNYIYSIKYNPSNIVDNGGGEPNNYDTLNKNVLSFVHLWRNSTNFKIRFNSWNDKGISFSSEGDWMATKNKAGVISGEDKQKLDSINVETLATKDELSAKQDILVSGESIKTINGESILGSGNIVIEGGSSSGNDVEDVSGITNVSAGSVKENRIYIDTNTIEDVPSTYAPDVAAPIAYGNIYIGNNGKLLKVYDKDTLTKTEASTTYALQTALQEALDRISALEAQIGVLSTQLDNINGEIIN